MAFLSKRKRVDASGIDLMETVTIGGISQALYFRGEDTKKPIILFLHGGPGQPFMPFLHKFQYELEKEYTVVQWDQRNSGKTFFMNDPETVLKTLSFEQSLKDAHEVTQYIKQKLNKNQMIVLGHSWGSVLGTALVQTYPHDYIAYISLGQVVSFLENERMGFDKLWNTVEAQGIKKDIAAIKSLAPYPLETYDEKLKEKLLKVRTYQAKYGLAEGGIKFLLAAVSSPHYSWKDKGYFGKDVLRYQEPIMRFLFHKCDIRNFGTSYGIPVFYIMGEQDSTTPYIAAKEYYEEITAPQKALFSVSDAGHFVMMDNKTEFCRVLLREIKPLIYER
jgi:pimeloyl-ACP methyl ester carboxylesterase